MSNIAANNELAPEDGLAVSPKDLAGFRAPYLAHSPGLYTALAERGFRYDTSGTAPSDAWPEKRDGIWRFNLAGIRISGSGRATLSMDYNFLVAQSGVGGDRLAPRGIPPADARQLSRPISAPITPAIARRSISGIISATIRTAPIATR